MRYQIRLLDQNLPGLTREIAQACWHATDTIVRNKLDNALYRDLYRAVREVFRSHVKAFRYCNAARVCEANIPRNAGHLLPPHEHYAGEHVHVYLLGAELPPKQFTREIVTQAVKAIVINLPRQPLHGLADALRLSVEKALDQRVFRSLRCGEDNLCHANEAYDPWDLRDPINVIQSA
ncbi:MAG: hypothetical protein HY293_04345 [Planctomycetes bacterium]|nr:hypothetical protein [Planctomycetota bacterium]